MVGRVICPTCQQPVPDPAVDTPSGEIATVVQLVTEGITTPRGVALALAGRRNVTPAEVEWCRRLLGRAVRAGRLTYTPSGTGGAGGTRPATYALP